MELTAKNDKGVVIHKSRRIYMPQCTDSLGPVMVLGPDRKLGIVRDTTFQPLTSKREQFEIKLSRPTPWLDLAVKLTYQLRPGDEITIQDWRKKISVAGIFGFRTK